MIQFPNHSGKIGKGRQKQQYDEVVKELMCQGLLLLIELFGDVNIYKNLIIDLFDSIIV